MFRIAIRVALGGAVMLLLLSPAFAGTRRATSKKSTAQPAPSAALDQPAASTSSTEIAAEAAGPFVPNTGRLRLFRSTRRESPRQQDQSTTKSPTIAETPSLANNRSPRVMRYEEVARGVPLVPTTKLAAAPAAPAATSASPPPARSRPLPQSAPAVPAPTAAPRADRLPPLNRVAPARVHPRVNLPQEPIVLYPETGE